MRAITYYVQGAEEYGPNEYRTGSCILTRPYYSIERRCLS